MSAVLLFHFPDAEADAVRQKLCRLSAVQVLSVPQSSFRLPLSRVLAGETASGFSPDLPCRMAVLSEDIQGPMFHLILDVCRQAASEAVLCAVLTETNRSWTALELCSRLLEEKQKLGG